MEGQYSHPVRIVAFNTAEGWSRDVTVDIADELRRRYIEFGEVSDSILPQHETHDAHWALRITRGGSCYLGGGCAL
jgi:hypothetical protein